MPRRGDKDPPDTAAAVEDLEAPPAAAKADVARPSTTSSGAAADRNGGVRSAAVRVVESRPWRAGVIALVLLDLAVVLAEVALTNAHPELEACKARPRSAALAAEGLHITTLALLAALNAEWLVRAAVLGPLRFFCKWQHWVDAWLVAAALGLEVALHGAEAITANLGLIVLRLARVAHALIELSMTEAAHVNKRARVRAVGLAWRLAGRAALAEARLARRGS